MVYILAHSEFTSITPWIRNYASLIRFIVLILMLIGVLFFTLTLVFTLPSISECLYGKSFWHCVTTSHYLLVVIPATLLLLIALVVLLRGLFYTPAFIEISNNGVFIFQGILRRRLVYIPRGDIERVEFRFKKWRDVFLPSRYWFLPLPLQRVAGVIYVYTKTEGVVEFYVFKEDIPSLSRVLRELGL